MFKKTQPPQQQPQPQIQTQTQQSISITSNYQSGGITAHTVNVGRPARHLTPVRAAELVQLLPRDKPVTVFAVMGDPEVLDYATEIASHLTNSGFAVTGPDQVMRTDSLRRVHVAPAAPGSGTHSEIVVAPRPD